MIQTEYKGKLISLMPNWENSMNEYDKHHQVSDIMNIEITENKAVNNTSCSKFYLQEHRQERGVNQYHGGMINVNKE